MSMKHYILSLLFCISINAFAQTNLTVKEMENKAKEEHRQRIAQSGGYSYTIWDDIPEMQSWGIGYSYNKTYPLTLYANYQVSYFTCALDLGVGFAKNPQFDTPNKTLKTNFQATLSPGVFLKYVSANFGIGAAFAETESQMVSSVTDKTTTDASNASASVDISTKTSTVTARLLLKPSLTGYIPVDDDDHFITVSVGYNFAPNFKDINGFVFGVGFQIPID